MDTILEKLLILMGILFVFAFSVQAQERRPIPYPVLLSPNFEAAVENGTRTLTGDPGPHIWSNSTTYQIEATLDPTTRKLEGHVAIDYTNNAPEALRELKIHLRQNLHAAGSIRNRPQKLTQGMQITNLLVRGEAVSESSSIHTLGYRINGTVMTIRLEDPLQTHETIRIDMEWAFEVPEAGAPRMGQDGEVFFLAYWYPQMAMYDDVDGWVAEQYQGNGEFYMGFADYEVSLTLPNTWLVGATGTLVNASHVLQPATLSRLELAMLSDTTISIVDAAARGMVTQASEKHLTWRFSADQVRDFAFGASDAFVWDATSATIGDQDGDGQEDRVLVHSLYRPDKAAWNRAAEFGQFAVAYMSDMFMPYPYPHMTVVEGVIGGGMEFPMITHIGGHRTESSLFSVTFHEIAHMWFPMMIGQNEKAFTWMDEGLTSFSTNEAQAIFFDVDAWRPGSLGYYFLAGSGREIEPMRHGDQYPYGTPARGLASYSKPAVALHALRGLVGQEPFMRAYRAYAERWAWKHPQPYDLFNTFEDLLSEDLDWFWTTMFYETWVLDHAISDVAETESGTTVTISDLGVSPFPVLLRARYANGLEVDVKIPVHVWLDGTTRSVTHTFKPGTIVSLEIDADAYLPDVNRSNNVWPAETQ